MDKAHLKLASAKAIIRLSKHWDKKIPIELFHLTLRTSEVKLSLSSVTEITWSGLFFLSEYYEDLTSCLWYTYMFMMHAGWIPRSKETVS